MSLACTISLYLLPTIQSFMDVSGMQYQLISPSHHQELHGCLWHVLSVNISFPPSRASWMSLACSIIYYLLPTIQSFMDVSGMYYQLISPFHHPELHGCLWHVVSFDISFPPSRPSWMSLACSIIYYLLPTIQSFMDVSGMYYQLISPSHHPELHGCLWHVVSVDISFPPSRASWMSLACSIS